MPIEIPPPLARFIDAHRVARLATVDVRGRPYIVPVCYARDNAHFFSAIDEKPKRAAPRLLQRLRNIAVNPNVALLIDDYSDDWSRLAYVVIHGTAVILEPDSSPASAHAVAVAALRQKYPQYCEMRIDASPAIQIEACRVRSWASGAGLESTCAVWIEGTT
jgi:PPOX class probable F420-dependent enzyme